MRCSRGREEGRRGGRGERSEGKRVGGGGEGEERGVKERGWEEEGRGGERNKLTMYIVIHM